VAVGTGWHSTDKPRATHRFANHTSEGSSKFWTPCPVVKSEGAEAGEEGGSLLLWPNLGAIVCERAATAAAVRRSTSKRVT